MTCQHCTKQMSGRVRKYCDQTCGRRAYSARRKADGRLRSYRQREDVRLRNRERLRIKITKTCERCGANYQCSATRRLDQRHCSRSCAALAREAMPPQDRCRVPDDHPARWFGMSTHLAYSDCRWCGQIVVAPVWRARRYCGAYCSRKASDVRRRSAETAYPGDRWTWPQFMAIVARFQWRCAYCDAPHTQTPDPDHVVPVSRGGRNRIGNILPACRACNGDKRDLLLTEWADDRARRSLPPRRTDFANERRAHHLTFVVEAAA